MLIYIFFQINGTEIPPSSLPASFHYTDDDVVSVVKTGATHISVQSKQSSVIIGYDGANGVNIQLPTMFFGRVFLIIHIDISLIACIQRPPLF